MTQLRRHMLADMQAQNLPRETHERYIVEVGNLAIYYWRSPDELSIHQVRDYLECCSKETLADEYYPGTVEAIRFFYTQTLRRRWDIGTRTSPVAARVPAHTPQESRTPEVPPGSLR